jgi:hypothetical protein
MIPPLHVHVTKIYSSGTQKNTKCFLFVVCYCIYHVLLNSGYEGSAVCYPVIVFGCAKITIVYAMRVGAIFGHVGTQGCLKPLYECFQLLLFGPPLTLSGVGGISPARKNIYIYITVETEMSDDCTEENQVNLWLVDPV